ncbi:putative F-box/LRR-repeat protein 23 [Vicia villosa]|uniref:putative F-box/LRR-repeat protein 23 n=1 Tax=Vicia villosa TaxID=3911 RepID=UPI00273B74D1|nr:putative F-box/LRR-repeat protein 23 [Vicia villosa]
MTFSIPTGPNWLELPRDVTENILLRLGTIDILTSACQVCPIWWNICKDPHMWRSINITKYGYNHSMHNTDKFVKICRNAIERSCGQVEYIDIEHFATDDLLAYIANRGLSDKGFSESVKKLSQLESLDISYQNQLSKDTFEIIGRYCPLLKTLKCRGIFPNDRENDVSFAIAKTMPGLHHLKFFGNMPCEDGVHAILDGCPLLESLDLKECCCFYNVRSLEKRCRENVKHFRPPSLHCCSLYYDSGWGIESENWFFYED